MEACLGHAPTKLFPLAAGLEAVGCRAGTPSRRTWST